MVKIKNIVASEKLDATGNLLIDIEIITTNDMFSHFALPLEVYGYKPTDILEIINNINTIIMPHIINKSVFEQMEMDNILTLISKNNIESFGVSVAIAKVAAYEIKMPLYRYLGGINAINIPQLIVSCFFDNEKNKEIIIMSNDDIEADVSIKMFAKIFGNLQNILKTKRELIYFDGVGRIIMDSLISERILGEAIEKAGYKLESDIFMLNNNSDRLRELTELKLVDTKTVTDMLDTIKNAHKNKGKLLISNNEEKTVDSFIVDVAVATNIDYMKIGMPYGGERVEKYNRLLKIHDMLR